MNANKNLIYLVEKMILSTKLHQLLLNDLDCQDCLLFLDIDLSILGASTQQYKLYDRHIHQEYKHLSNHNYCQARIRVFKNFLARNKIYHTNYFYLKLEKQLGQIFWRN